jgi:predicted alpha/beta-hydrolase family hydrolase
MKYFSALVTLALGIVSISASASDQQIDIKTPRGSLIKLDIYNPGSPKVLLLAPGQGCSARLEMYDAIAAEAKLRGFTVVRTYWAYCLTTPTGGASQDLSLEREDFVAALDYVRGELKFNSSQVFIGGKSLGSLISFDLFNQDQALQGLVLLTPVCTDSTTTPGLSINSFANNYQGLDSETRPVLIAQGNADPLCEANHFQEYLKGKSPNFAPLSVAGDHGFGSKKSNGTYDTALAAKNIEVVSKWIFTWFI